MLKTLIKKYLPQNTLRMIGIPLNQLKSKVLARLMPKLHSLKISKIRKKEKIRVLFLVIHRSVWKYQSVYERMLLDPLFDVELLVCPDLLYGEEQMRIEMDTTFRFFEAKGYAVTKSLGQNGSWLPLSKLSPDLVMFTNQNQLTVPNYFAKAYTRHLSIYVPYFFMATSRADAEIFNTPMLNAMWRIYWPHRFAFDAFNSLSEGDPNRSSRLTGYPAVEALLTPSRQRGGEVWKRQAGKKKVIYAPHHSISDNESRFSTFLRLGPIVKDIAERYSQQVQWSFKPHPHLKPRLYLHPSWGKERTDHYFDFWDSQSFTQLNDGEYEALFNQSDAIIHDCSSFIAEYAVTMKPALYLLSKSSEKLDFLNEFGKCALQSYDTGTTAQHIEEFILRLLDDTQPNEYEAHACFDEYLSELYSGRLPSERIIEDIKEGLGLIARENEDPS